MNNKKFEIDKLDEWNDIAKMPNYLDVYNSSIINSLATRIDVNDISIGNISILESIADLVQNQLVGEYVFIPNFAGLKEDTIEKLKQGIYKIGNSKKVKGDIWAVITDQNNNRIEDVTFKQLENNNKNINNLNNIAIQMQLKSIEAKLDTVINVQEFQNDANRNSKINIPIRMAQEELLKIRGENNDDFCIGCLEKADNYLKNAWFEIEYDIINSYKYMIKEENSIYRGKEMLNNYIFYIVEDLKLLPKVAGLRFIINNKLEKISEINRIEKNYKDLMYKIGFEENDKNETMIDRIHSNFTYSKNDKEKDGWLKMQEKIQQLEKLERIDIKNKKIFLMEGINNGKQ